MRRPIGRRASAFRSWYRVGRLPYLRAPLFVHWPVLVALGFIALYALQQPIYAGLAAASYLAVLLVHETGHALVARGLGYDVLALRISIIHGKCECEHPDSQWHDVLIAWGGVTAQIAVAAPVIGIAAFVNADRPGYYGPVETILGYYSLLVAIFNLIPAPGFDGYTAWRVVPVLFARVRVRSQVRKMLGKASRRR